MTWHIEPQHIPLVIAAASLIAIPLVVKAWSWLYGLWLTNEATKLDSAITAKLTTYVTTEDLDVQIDQLTKHTDTLHAESRQLLHSIKEDGKTREGLILGTIKQAQEETRHNITEQNKAISTVHARVDTLLTLQGDRRRRD